MKKTQKILLKILVIIIMISMIIISSILPYEKNSKFLSALIIGGTFYIGFKCLEIIKHK